MTTNLNEMKKLCTASEWVLVQESLPGNIDTFSPARLKTKASAAERLRKKWLDLSRKQKRAAGDNEAAFRSIEKAILFGEVYKAFNEKLHQLELDAFRLKIIKQLKMTKKTRPGGKKHPSIPRTTKPQKDPANKKSIGVPASIKGHISSRNRRDQVRRDSK